MTEFVSKIPAWLEEMNSNPDKYIPSCFNPPHLPSEDVEDPTLDFGSVQKIQRSISALSFDDLSCSSNQNNSVKDSDHSSKTTFPRHGRRAVSCQLGKNKRKKGSVDSFFPVPYVESNLLHENSSRNYYENTVNTINDQYSLPYVCGTNENYHSFEELFNTQSSFDSKSEEKKVTGIDNYEDVFQIVKPSRSEGNLREDILKPTLLANDFIIPELPAGQRLRINILNNWGDQHYVGLNGLDIFSSLGTPVNFKKIWTNLQDASVSTEYFYELQSVENLINGINRTQDDLNLWLAPFTSGKEQYIEIVFDEKVQIAMIRIWNYNKSRIHSYRGVRDIELILDGAKIFLGEIARASGSLLGGMGSFGDIILFTTDEKILELTSKNDCAFFLINDESTHVSENFLKERPLTTHTEVSQESANLSELSNLAPSIFGEEKEIKLKIRLLENWGHDGLIGLNGIEILSTNGRKISVDSNAIKCSKSDDVFKLVDGINCTDNKTHMWCKPFVKGEAILIEIYLPHDTSVGGIRIWNYNESLDLISCGAKLCSIYLNEKIITPPEEHLLLRRAPGHCHYDFFQEYFFHENTNSSVVSGSNDSENMGCIRKKYTMPVYELPLSQDDEQLSIESENLTGSIICAKLFETSSEEYEPPLMPKGFVYEIALLSTWGDFYYVGLTGIELLDEFGRKIDLSEKNITAYPHSVNILDGISNDIRTPDKLINGCNDISDGRNMWIAPVLPDIINKVFIIFDNAVTVSKILIWNYGKMPSRGAKEFAILVDDLLVYNGQINKASIESPSNVPHKVVCFGKEENLDAMQQLLQDKSSSSNFLLSKKIGMSLEQGLVARGELNQPDQDSRPFTSLVS